MTMHHIASVVSGSGGSATFSNIPQTFTHLHVRIIGRSINPSPNTYSTMYGGFNDDLYVANNYHNHAVYTDGSSISTPAQNPVAQINFGIGNFVWDSLLANMQGVFLIDILDYANTTKNKVVSYTMGWDTNGNGRAMLGSSVWMNTAAIQKFSVSPDAGFSAGTRIDLYGVTSSPTTGA